MESEEADMKEYDKDELEQAAIDNFGTTQRFAQAGYILSDGKLLDFGYRGERGEDHRAVEVLFEGEDYEPRFAAVELFCETTGAIRFMPEVDGFDIFTMPTKKQFEVMAYYISAKNGEVIVECQGGKENFYHEYEKGTDWQDVVSDIVKYFNALTIRKNNPARIRRGKASAPARLIHDTRLDEGRVLDYGCGYGEDAKRYGWEKYDPATFPKMPRGKFDTIISIYVLNIMNRARQHALLREMRKHLKKNGVLIVAVRRDLPKNANGPTQWYVKLPARPIYESARFAIYAICSTRWKD
jgi:hypothetical protein